MRYRRRGALSATVTDPVFFDERGLASMASALKKSSGPLDGVALPDSERFAIRLGPRAARFILRGLARSGGAGRRSVSASRCQRSSAAPMKMGGRAALWLGPDEWLLIAEGEAPDALGRELEGGAGADAPHCAGRYLAAPDRAGAGRPARCPHAERRLPARSRARGVSSGSARRRARCFPKREAVLWRQGPAALPPRGLAFVRRAMR